MKARLSQIHLIAGAGTAITRVGILQVILSAPASKYVVQHPFLLSSERGVSITKPGGILQGDIPWPTEPQSSRA